MLNILTCILVRNGFQIARFKLILLLLLLLKFYAMQFTMHTPVFDLASFCGSFRITMSKLNLVATHFMPCSVHCEQNANELWFCTPAAVDQVAIWAVVYSL